MLLTTVDDGVVAGDFEFCRRSIWYMLAYFALFWLFSRFSLQFHIGLDLRRVASVEPTRNALNVQVSIKILS